MDVGQWGVAIIGGVAALALAGTATAGETTSRTLAIEGGLECVDINGADLEELLTLKHVTNQRAQDILDLRPFHSIDDLSRVDGLMSDGERLQELVHGGNGWTPLCPVKIQDQPEPWPADTTHHPQLSQTPAPAHSHGVPDYPYHDYHPPYPPSNQPDTSAYPRYGEPTHPYQDEVHEYRHQSPHQLDHHQLDHHQQVPKHPHVHGTTDHPSPDQLPVTGTGLPLLLGAGTALIGTGATTLLIARRRATR